jgi:hypothetical protein
MSGTSLNTQLYLLPTSNVSERIACRQKHYILAIQWLTKKASVHDEFIDVANVVCSIELIEEDPKSTFL